MISTNKSQRRFFPMAAVVAAGVSLFSATGAIAADFTFQDDPSSFIDDSAAFLATDGNNRNVNDLQLVNTGEAADELGFAVTNAFSVFEGNFLSLEWDNQLDGWFTDSYDGQGNSLLVTLTNVADRIALGDLADLTGEAQFPLTQPCGDSLSCLQGPPFTPVTQEASDEVPLFRLGSFASGESKFFSESFNFDFEDNRDGSLPLLAYGVTVRPTGSAAVPEPTSVIALVMVGVGATQLKRKNKSE